jgi:mono/diheme cytochrome c family protein
MSKAVRWLGYGVGVIAALVVAAVILVWILSERALAEKVEPRKSHLASPTAAQMADGPRQLRILGCLSCHGPGLQGQKFIEIPGVATIHAPNISRLAPGMSDAQLDHAIRQGIGHDGRALFVMPSQEYQFMTDQEVAALIGAIRKLPVGGQDQPRIALLPKGRVGVALGKFPNVPRMAAAYRDQPLPDLGPATAEGRHLVQINCSECHGADLKGREIHPGAVSADLSIAGAYDSRQFRDLLRTGTPVANKKLGLMGDVARSDFSHMTDDEIDAIHTYLVELANRPEH